GLCRAASHELPHVGFSCLDVTDDRPTDELAKRVAAGLSDPSAATALLRGGCWLTRRLAPVHLPAAVENSSYGFRRGGVYLIAGGAGGIGLELALWLRERFDARVVLTGRRPASSLPETVAARIAGAGGALVYLQADLTDEAAVTTVVAEAKNHFG